MFTLRHSGRMGDVLYSLYYATHLTQGKPFNLLLRANVRDYCDPSGRPYLMTREDAEFMSPLLEYQPYINRVTIAENEREVPQDAFILDKFRMNMYGIIGREIRTWYYGVRENIPPGEFTRKVLSAPDFYDRRAKFAICFTQRYREAFDVEPVLREYKDDLVFVGLPEEHRDFCRECFDVDYKPVAHALDLLSFLQSCRGFIGNVSGTYAIAECAKIPRILCLARDNGNVRVYGNGVEVKDPETLKTTIENMRKTL